VKKVFINSQLFCKQMNPNALWKMLIEVYHEWSDVKASRLAAALAFYTILSLAPILIIVISIAGFAFGEPAVLEEIAYAMQSLVGEDGAIAIKMVMEHAALPGHSTLAAIMGLIVLLFGAAEVFIQLKDSLNEIWDVGQRLEGGILATIREYFFSLSMVVGIGFMLLVSLVVDAALSAFGAFIGTLIPDNEIFLRAITFTSSFAVITFLFALIYKVVPDASVAWCDVWVGAAFTTLLFIAGKLLIGLYISYSAEGAAYGAAGSVVILMLWVYYSPQIFLMGAEFTKVFAQRFGSKIKHLMPLT
jgi:membrane protein